MDRKQAVNGSISIFLILVLVPLYACISMVVGSVRYSAGRSRLLGILNLNGNSALNRYELTLKRQFDLFSMGEPEDELQERLEAQYLEMIVPNHSGIVEDKNVVTVNPDTYEVHYPDRSILARPENLNDTIFGYMKERAPLLFAREFQKKYAGIFRSGTVPETKLLPEKLIRPGAAPEPVPLQSGTAESLVEQEFDGLSRWKRQDPGSFINMQDQSVSALVGAEQAARIDSYAAGAGSVDSVPSQKEEKEAGQKLFQSLRGAFGAEQLELEEYMTHMFSCYTTGEEEKSLTDRAFSSRSLFRGEQEYLLFGADSKRANVVLTAQSLLALRVYINGLYAYSSPKLQAEAMEAAGPLMELTGAGATAIAEAIIALWVFAESANDVRTLLDGGSVPFYKTDATWRTGISGAASQSAGTGSPTDLTYKDYLKLFLFGKLATPASRRSVLARTAKLMQATCSEEDRNFDITRCYQQLEIKAGITAVGHRITREEVYSY